jgi:hypothetical protein
MTSQALGGLLRLRVQPILPSQALHMQHLHGEGEFGAVLGNDLAGIDEHLVLDRMFPPINFPTQSG